MGLADIAAVVIPVQGVDGDGFAAAGCCLGSLVALFDIAARCKWHCAEKGWDSWELGDAEGMGFSGPGRANAGSNLQHWMVVARQNILFAVHLGSEVQY